MESSGMESKIREFSAFKISGFIVLAVIAAIVLFGGWYLFASVQGLESLLARGLKVTDFIGNEAIAEFVVWLAAILLAIVIPSVSGFSSVEPNQAIVLVLFGSYIGTVREAGFWWTNALAAKQKISLWVRNLNSKIIKVNDAEGSPIEIAAAVVWQVIDSARSIFAVNCCAASKPKH